MSSGIALPAPVRRRAARLRAPALSRADALGLGAAILVGVAIRVTYVVVTRNQPLAGDEATYDAMARLLAQGHGYSFTLPYGNLHTSLWKAPGYTGWLAFMYFIFGHHTMRAELVQTILIAPVTITLTWMLGRRLFGSRAGLAAAALVAVYPFAWLWETKLYSESLATPLTVAVLYVVLERRPSARRVLGAGVLMGLAILVRPSSALLFAGIAVSWWATAGARRGTLALIGCGVVAALCVAPWTVRNAVVSGRFVPVSIQSDAGYGTFNAQAAHDPVYPYAWRPIVPAVEPVFAHRHPPLSDAEFGARLRAITFDYIDAHPASLPKAFFWNGLSRLWDIRQPAHVLHEAGAFEGRSKGLTAVGLVMYWAMILPLALFGLWRHRRRRGLLLAVLAIALAASVAFTSDSGTRYRTTLVPLVVVWAGGAALARPRAPDGAGRPVHPPAVLPAT